MKTWVKLYTEIIDDPKMARLTWEERGIWSALLALAGKLDIRNDKDDPTGELETTSHIAWHLRCAEDEIASALAKFAECEMMHQVDGIWIVTNFCKFQAIAESDKPGRVAARQARHRSKITSPIFARDNWTCRYCGKHLELDECTIDHVIPVSYGGREDDGNLVTACKTCNSSKNARTPEQAHMKLIPLANDDQPLRNAPIPLANAPRIDKKDTEKEKKEQTERVETRKDRSRLVKAWHAYLGSVFENYPAMLKEIKLLQLVERDNGTWIVKHNARILENVHARLPGLYDRMAENVRFVA